MAKKSEISVEEGSGNVFADLGVPNPEQEKLKAGLNLQIYQIIKKRALTQAEAGEILGIKQPMVSLLMRNRSGSFSLAKLMDFLTKLDLDIEITVKPKPRKAPTGRVSIHQFSAPKAATSRKKKPPAGSKAAAGVA